MWFCGNLMTLQLMGTWSLVSYPMSGLLKWSVVWVNVLHVIRIDRVCHNSYYQLRVIAQALTFKAVVSLSHAFEFSRLQYCGYISNGVSLVWMERPRQVHRAVVRLIGGVTKTDRLSQYMWRVLHWLLFPQRISYRIESPFYVSFGILSSCAGQCALWSSVLSFLVVPLVRSATVQRYSFSLYGPTTWIGLPSDLRQLSTGVFSQFHQLFKTVLYCLA